MSPQWGRRQTYFPEDEILIVEAEKGRSFEVRLTQLSLTNV